MERTEMRRNLVLMIVIALLAALMTGCSPAKVAEKITEAGESSAALVEQEEQPVAEAEDAAPEKVDEEVEEPEAEAEPTSEDETDEDELVIRDLDELDLTSYRSEWAIETLEEGVQESFTMLIEYSAEGPAMRTLIGASDADDAMEVIRIGDTTYMRSGGEWMSMESSETDPIDATVGTFHWADPQQTIGEDCDRKGTESVDGHKTVHYRCETNAIQKWVAADEDVKLDEAYADYYVSQELGLVVKSSIFWSGDRAGDPISYQLDTLVTSINEPVSITAPEGVAAPGVPEDIAIPLDAEDKSSFGTMVSFRVNHPVGDVITWYEEQMPANDWELDADASMSMEDMASQSWVKEGRTATVIISADDDATSVVITVEGE